MKNIESQLGMKNEKFDFRTGDTIKVFTKVIEGDSERVQVFDGVLMGRRGSGISESFTVRKISYGVGVERVFPVHSPRIDKIELVKTGKVRRAKIYYLRELSGKSARLEEKTEGVTEPTATNSAAPAAPAPVPAPAPGARSRQVGYRPTARPPTTGLKQAGGQAGRFPA